MEITVGKEKLEAVRAVLDSQEIEYHEKKSMKFKDLTLFDVIVGTPEIIVSVMAAGASSFTM